MGVIYNIKCSKCNTSQELYLGGGILDNRIDNIIQHFEHDQSAVSKINNMLNSDASLKKFFSFEYKLGISKDKKIAEVPCLTIENENIVGLMKNGDRPVSVYEIDDIDNGTIVCPVCGQILETEFKGCWD